MSPGFAYFIGATMGAALAFLLALFAGPAVIHWSLAFVLSCAIVGGCMGVAMVHVAARYAEGDASPPLDTILDRPYTVDHKMTPQERADLREDFRRKYGGPHG